MQSKIIKISGSAKQVIFQSRFKYLIFLVLFIVICSIIYFSYGDRRRIEMLDIGGITRHSSLLEYIAKTDKDFLAEFSDDPRDLKKIRLLKLGKYNFTCHTSFKYSNVVDDMLCDIDYGKKTAEVADYLKEMFSDKYGRPTLNEKDKTAWCDEDGNALTVYDGYIALHHAFYGDCHPRSFEQQMRLFLDKFK